MPSKMKFHFIGLRTEIRNKYRSGSISSKTRQVSSTMLANDNREIPKWRASTIDDCPHKTAAIPKKACKKIKKTEAATRKRPHHTFLNRIHNQTAWVTTSIEATPETKRWLYSIHVWCVLAFGMT